MRSSEGGPASSQAAPRGADRYLRLAASRSAQLGAGSYGIVYAAWDQVNHQLVAVKEQEVSSEDAIRELFFMHAAGNHPNLVEVYDQFVHGNSFRIVFEYAQASLWDVWKRACGFLDWDLAYQYSQQILMAVEFLHRQNIVHRDISLSNVLIDGRANAAKLADLGMAACASSFVIERMVSALAYRAPEMLLEFDTLQDGQVPLDLWSLGAVWCALFAATHIFGDGNCSLRGVFRAQALFIGRPPPATWPECTSGPSWADLQSALPPQEEYTHRGPDEFLVDVRVVRRSMASHDDMINLLTQLLTWKPTSRPTAAAALQHPVWKRCTTGSAPDREAAPDVDDMRLPLSEAGGQMALSQLPPHSAPQPPALCACNGNCGLVTCNRNKARYYYCKRKGQPASKQFCVNSLGCGSLCADCENSRRTTGKSATDEGKWSWELRAVAQHGKFLNDMTPCDLTAFIKAADEIVGDGEVTGHALLRMWVAAFIKLPTAVAAWTKGFPAFSQNPQPAEWTEMYAAATQALATELRSSSSSAAMEWESEQVTTGYHTAIFGPLELFKRLGATPRPSQTSTEQTLPPTTPRTPVQLLWGKRRVEHQVVCTKSMWKDLVDVAEKTPTIKAPTSMEEAFHVVRALCHFLGSFPRVWGHGPPVVFEGGHDSESSTGYVRKHLLRKFILWFQHRFGDEAWEKFTVTEVLFCTPDRGGFLAPLRQDATASELRERFGTSAFMISCWACLFNGVKQEHRSAFQAGWDTECLWQLARTLRDDHGGAAPSLAVLATAAATSQPRPVKTETRSPTRAQLTAVDAELRRPQTGCRGVSHGTPAASGCKRPRQSETVGAPSNRRQ